METKRQIQFEFRKKPVVVQAVKCLMHEYADNPLIFEIVPQWLQDAISQKVIVPEFRSEDYWYYTIKTLEGEMLASPGDWIIRGSAGELYPCKPELFAEYYGEESELRSTKEAPQCQKQYHMYVWTKEPFFYAVAQAGSVDEARSLMLEEIGGGDGSCPERESAAEYVRERQPYIFHRSNATFGLTDSAELSEQIAHSEKLEKKLKELAASRSQEPPTPTTDAEDSFIWKLIPDFGGKFSTAADCKLAVKMAEQAYAAGRGEATTQPATEER